MATADPDRNFTTRAQMAFRRGGARRLAIAAAVAVAFFALLILLGPDQESVKRRFEYYGAPGEIKIMPEISITEGQDAVHQIPRSLRKPPPPAEVEIEEDDNDPDATETVRKPNPADKRRENDPSEMVTDVETAEIDQVQFSLPRQSNPDWFILVLERPEYPVRVAEAERRTPVIVVRAAIFVGPDGSVMESMILSSTGSAAFSDAVLDALSKWVFGWRVDPGVGRWIEMTWNFRSPYFNP